jgi:ABC-2 type transport system permease protein
MKRIFEIELIKLRHGKTTKVIAIIYASITILSLILFGSLWDLGHDTYQNFNGITDTDSVPFLSFPFVWLAGTYVSSFLIMFPAILSILHASNEFSSKIHRQHIIDGLSKDEYILSKFFSVLIISLAFTIYTALLCIIMGLMNNVSGIIPQEFLDEMSKNIFRDTYPLTWLFGYFLYTFSILSFGLLLSFIFKKTGRSIFAFIGYYLVIEGVIIGLTTIWTKSFLLAKFAPISSIANNLLPSLSGSTLKLTDTNNIDRLSEREIYRDIFSLDFTDVLTAIIYIGIYFLLIRWIFLRRDLN